MGKGSEVTAEVVGGLYQDILYGQRVMLEHCAAVRSHGRVCVARARVMDTTLQLSLGAAATLSWIRQSLALLVDASREGV